ncbi:hypothetical protein [[Mycobacterium] burgundiense]|uniref:Uroporphyrinogen decarboxylase (URO-D) domain-containing protein n=1 Tax=[Mycobacterium] burgundiense TaxID=3064286 RepID=A0ABN9NPL9_9MYCO|nr:hypothetical protein [Mycolicibacterium sp. MU0053]CAJ1510064.1 hypothetical protein MU0053_004424 [Mycolicibacterium sp. MU0053]
MSKGSQPVSETDVLLVGSMPFGTAEEAMRAAAGNLGQHLGWVTDGEVGPRAGWVAMLPLVVFPNTPCVVETKAPDTFEQPETEAGTPPAEDLPAVWTWKLREGHDAHFEDLAYGTFALESWSTFSRLRDEGVIPEHMRFQVCLPSPHSAIDSAFEDPGQWPELYAAYLEGIRREIGKILEVVPAADLVFQWDLALEFIDMGLGDNRRYFASWPTLPLEEKFARHVEQLDELWKGIPEEALLGYHWCYGTWGGWPMTAMTDLDLCVRMSNEAKKRAGRRLDYVHMPVAAEADDAFFAPLDRLAVGDTRVFLGIVHHTDGVEEFRRRRDLARKHLADFGIGSVCGFGRLDPELLPEVLANHGANAKEL